MKQSRTSRFRPNRRQVLEGASIAAGASMMTSSLAGRVSAALPAPTSPTVIVVFLRGGADALSWVAPVDDAHYIARRPSLAVPRPTASEPQRWLGASPTANQGLALPIGATVPPTTNMADVFAEGHLTFAVGTALPCVTATGCVQLKSHFEAMNLLETGNTAGASSQATEGWLSRYLDRLASSSTVSGLTHGALQVRSLAEAARSPAVPDVADYPFPGPSLAAPERKTHYGLLNVSSSEPSPAYLGAAGAAVSAQELLEQVDQTISGAAFPASPFGEALRKTANILLQGPGLSPQPLRPDVIHIDYGGWDHHLGQETNPPPAPGTPNPDQFYAKSVDVSQALGAFYQAMGKDAGVSKYHLIVMSEFGRRVFENGDAGTDHGAAGIAMFMGDGVFGGNFNRSVLFPNFTPFNPQLPTSTGLRSMNVVQNFGLDDEDLVTGVDIRELIGEVLVERTALSSSDVFGNPNSVFPTIQAPAAFQGVVG